jgi:hypothetical protein
MERFIDACRELIAAEKDQDRANQRYSTARTELQKLLSTYEDLAGPWYARIGPVTVL